MKKMLLAFLQSIHPQVGHGRLRVHCFAGCRVKACDHLEVRLSGDEKVSQVGMGFALNSLMVQLPHVIVAGIPSVDRAVVTFDDKTKK